MSDWSVTFGDVPFSTTRTFPTADAAAVIVASLSGWWDGAASGTAATPHGTGDGSIPGLRRLAPRTIELRGLIEARTAMQMLAAKAAFTRSREGRFIVDEPSLATRREADVRRLDLELTDRSPLVCQYRMTLLADDPLRYSSEVTTLRNGSIFLPNRGDKVAVPVIEVQGPHPLIGIIAPRGTWTLAPTPAGVNRVVDLRNGDIWQGGKRVFRLEQGQAPVVNPGGVGWGISGLGAGAAIVRRYEAWS